jgi:carboxyl-terminal processing protease
MRKMHLALSVALLALIGTGPIADAQSTGSQSTQQSRLALVVGVAAYRSLNQLENTIRDAQLVTEAIESTGFKVVRLLDPDASQLRAAVTAFSEDLRRTDAIGLVYFAGHGVQVEGVNYLLPADVDSDPAGLTARGVSLDDLLFLMSSNRASARLNIVIIDACRENVFGAGGLANVRQKLPKGSSFFIAYATSPGDVASDGEPGKNGPYALELATAVKKPWVPIDGVFNEVHNGVASLSKGTQLPWHARSFTGNFYFSFGPEQAFWDRIQGSRRPEDFLEFLEQFPSGRFARNACIMAREFSRTERATPASAALNTCPTGIDGHSTSELFARSSLELIDEARLKALSCEELWIARNEIFRRFGYCFRGEKGLAYFGNRGCTTSYDDILALDPERAIALRNVYMIRSTASAKFCAGQ